MNIHIGDTGCNSEVALPLSQLFLHSHDMEELWLGKLIYLFLLSISIYKILIDVGGNKIGSEGCVKIVQSLREHKMLKALNLSKYMFMEELSISSYIITIYSNKFQGIYILLNR